MKPIAIVTPWFGKKLKGGAEQQAWQMAVRLSEKGHQIEVLTTCCRSFLDNWDKNHLQAGKYYEDNFVIRRFKVDKRRANRFNFVNSMMLAIPPGSLKPGCNPIPYSDSKIFAGDNINSALLLKYLKENNDSYRAFIFIPYLYGPILNGLPLVAEKAYLQPCLHDEVYAYLPQVEKIFREAHRILFNSEGELLLASGLYGPGILTKSVVTGEGIELKKTVRGARALRINSIDLAQNRYFLYLGRRDLTKNVDLLVRAYLSYKNSFPESDLKLLLAGPGKQSFNDWAQGVYDLGFVSEREKAALLTNCLVLCQPSRHESYSRVMMEAWSVGRPVIASRRCEATALAVQSAAGGWLAGDESEWKDRIFEVDRADENELNDLGSNGQAYAEKYADWSLVIERYEKILKLTNRKRQKSTIKKEKIRAIHQLTAGIEFGDAITNQTLLIRDHLRSRGFQSEIYAQHVDSKMLHAAKAFKPIQFGTDTGLIYHHSIGSDITQFAIKHSGPKCLIYHNVTPADFQKTYNSRLADLLEQGRRDLKPLAKSFEHAAGVSAFNREELVKNGFLHPGIWPVCVDPNQWNIDSNPELMEILQDGTTNLMYVGRVVPNKCQHHLLKAFLKYLNFDNNARLIIVGDINPPNSYYKYLLQIVEQLGLKSKVVFTGKESNDRLQAFYRTAHLFWSMSEHEGFGIPLIEAMWFDIPVLAYKSSAVPETLGIGGITFTKKDDLDFIAALAKTMVDDDALRLKIIDAQRIRRKDFLPETVMPQIDVMIEKMIQ